MKKVIFIILLSMGLCGCISVSGILPSYAERRDYITSHPELSSQVKESIMNGVVVKGMTKDDVVSVWGKPDYMNHVQKDNEQRETWDYGNRVFAFRHKFVEFDSQGLVIQSYSTSDQKI